MSVLVLWTTGDVGPHVVSELAARGELRRVLVCDAVRARTVLDDQAVPRVGSA